jgi:hypothetical protein
MQFTLLLFFATMLVTGALESVSIFDYTQVPACARNCKILAIAEAECVPPGALMSNKAQYVSCFCKSAVLERLHSGVEMCHHVCSNDHFLAIHRYYERLCYALPDSPSSVAAASSSSPSSAPLSAPTWSWISIPSSMATMATQAPSPPSAGASTSSQTITSISVANEPTAAPSPPPTKNETWLHSHLKYLLIAGILGAVVFLLLIFLAFLFHRRHRNAQKKSSNRDSGLIPLQLLSSSRSTRQSQPRMPRSDFGSTSAENLPSTAPASPLVPTHSPHSLGDSLRFYAQEARERDEYYARRAALARAMGTPASTAPKNIGWRHME